MHFPRLDIDALVWGSPLPLDVDAAKKHARVDSSDEDDLVQLYLRAAIEWVEDVTHRTIITRTHRWILKDFPLCEIVLPRGKSSAVSQIQYVAGGQTFTMRGPTSGSPAGSDYQEDLRSDVAGILMPPQGESWPSVDYDAIAPITIEFSAGWQAAQVPMPITHAIYFAVADMLELRSQADFSPAMVAAAGPRYAAREALISPYKIMRWY
jgi:uncharacterized phiE125 gp8 family phage protein